MKRSPIPSPPAATIAAAMMSPRRERGGGSKLCDVSPASSSSPWSYQELDEPVGSELAASMATRREGDGGGTDGGGSGSTSSVSVSPRERGAGAGGSMAGIERAASSERIVPLDWPSRMASTKR